MECGFDISFELTKIRTLEQWGNAPRIELESILREKPSLVNQALNIYQYLLRTDLFSADIVAVLGAAAMLNNLRKEGIETAVISGMAQDILDSLSEEFKFNFSKDNLISTIDTEDPLKQKTTGYHLAKLITEKGWKKEEVIVVGDAKSDVIMARTLHIKPVVVLTGMLTKQEAIELGVEIILPSVADLSSII